MAKEFETYGSTAMIPLGSWESRGDLTVAASETPSGSPTEKLKIASIPQWRWTKWDGEVAVSIDNMQTTFRLLYNGPKPSRLLVRTSWSQYNNTQNNKKNHVANFQLNLLGAQGQVIGNPITTSIIRDYCRADGGNPQASPEQEIDLTIYDRLTTIHYGWYLWWEYEGAC
jgi:hypothetical protein